MQYCKNCQRLVEGDRCPYCRSSKLRVALDADFCLVAELPYMQAEMLKELFDDNGVPCTERSVLGAGIISRLGSNVDRIRLYVPYAQFDEAKGLYDAFFNAPEIMDLPDGMQEFGFEPDEPEPAADPE